MNNVSSIKSIKTDSPKTPGGISKSLLTPCRRLGLSRKFKKVGPVPFVSPLSGNSSNQVDDTKKPKKRKKSEELEKDEDGNECSSETPLAEDGIADVDESDIKKRTLSENEDLSATPIRHVGIPFKKKSKTLSALHKRNTEKVLLVSGKQTENVNTISQEKEGDNINTKAIENVVIPLNKSGSKKFNSLSKTNDKNITSENSTHVKDNVNELDEVIENITPLQKAKSKSNKSKKSLISKTPPKTNSKKKVFVKKTETNDVEVENQENITQYSVKPKSPNELTKECIVVIQKKIFKTDKKGLGSHKQKNYLKTKDLHESDSDDIPLCQLNKDGNVNVTEKNISGDDTKETTKEVQKDLKVQEEQCIDDEEEDFMNRKKKKLNVKDLKDKATSISGLKNKTKINKPKVVAVKPAQVSNVSDFDDEDDFDFDNKKTILIRKTYEKVSKPQKAKTTGSITQQDIDELRARIEAKKKLLLARAMTEDTEELRALIKRWQKGCQDALMELMELMKTKFPDKQSMDYSEMLSMLKIPVNLVGYDEENDCFNTPEDANIILSNFKDL